MVDETGHERCANNEDGRVVIRDRDGAELGLRPWLEHANAEGFPGDFFGEILGSRADVLAERVLEDGEPSHARISGMLPRAIGETFVGDSRRDERFIIQPDGSVEGLLGPLADITARELALHARWGLVHRRLPLPILRIGLPDRQMVEQIAVADIDAAGEARLLVRRRDGDRVDHLAPAGGCDEAEDAFCDAVLTQWRLVSEFHERGMRLTGGDELLGDLAASSLWLADLTLRGCHPRYGIGTYDRFKDHGFPPTVIHLGSCLVEWGHFERARDVIDCYLNAYVADDGSFVYYGPAVSEYGQLLSLCARYLELSGDLRWWRGRESVLRRIWTRLRVLRRESLADDSAPEHARGLIPGLPEADYHGSEEQWREYYYSGDAWAVRGLTDVARALQVTGRSEEAAALEEGATQYRADLLASVHAAGVATDEGLYVPPGPTQRVPIERMTQDRHSSYCNYRYFAEMISAGVLPQRVVRRVLDWRATHGGELLAMTRFEGHLDDWPVLNYARALLETGEIERYQLLLYAHLAHHQAAGWLAAPEQVDIVPGESGVRRYHAGQVVPCQVTVPLMLRWALLYELRDEDVLLVAPAVEHRWLCGGGLSARGLPTRWGPVDLELDSDGRTVTASLGLPVGTPAVVRLRIPRSPDAPVVLASVTGAAEQEWDESAGAVTLSQCGTKVTVRASVG